MSWQLYDKHQRSIIVSLWLITAIIQATIDGQSRAADFSRLAIPIANWQPLLWEFTSQLATISTLPIIIWFDRKFSLSSPKLFRNLIMHCGFTVVFSLCHVIGMVLLRHLGYFLMSSQYDFGDWTIEFFYEYRKDAYSYFGLLLTIYSYRFIVSRLRGEAVVVAEGEDSPKEVLPERLLVKKLGKEFIIKITDIDWIEASGNYMNLHVGTRIYPLRIPMKDLESKLSAQQFSRIHRSFIVNLDRVREITPLETGDYKIQLSTGQTLNFSRRYRDNLEKCLV